MKLYIKSSSDNSEKKFNLLEKRIKEAVDIINNWMKTESTSVLEVLNNLSYAYEFANEYMVDYYILDAKSIINDFRARLQAGEDWDPRSILEQILCDCVGMSYRQVNNLLYH